MSIGYSYKVLGSVPIPFTANTGVPLYRVPRNNTAIISSVNACNLRETNARFTVALVPGAEYSGSNIVGYFASNHLVIANVLVPGRDSVGVNLGATLEEDTQVVVLGTNSDMAFHVFGAERNLKIDTFYATSVPPPGIDRAGEFFVG